MHFLQAPIASNCYSYTLVLFCQLQLLSNGAWWKVNAQSLSWNFLDGDSRLPQAPRSAKALIYAFLGVFMTLKIYKGTPPALSIFSDLAENAVFRVCHMHSHVIRKTQDDTSELLRSSGIFRDPIALSFQWFFHDETQEATATPVRTPNFPNSSFRTSCRDDP